jgi:hypothetical protein
MCWHIEARWTSGSGGSHAKPPSRGDSDEVSSNKMLGGGLSSGLGGELHAWGLASSRSAGGILGSRHCSLLRSMDCVAICGNNIRVFLGVREVQDDGDGVLRV